MSLGNYIRREVLGGTESVGGVLGEEKESAAVSGSGNRRGGKSPWRVSRGKRR